MFISTDAIVLKNTPYKESSIISRLFTRESGKISTIFKGAKKNKLGHAMFSKEGHNLKSPAVTKRPNVTPKMCLRENAPREVPFYDAH